MFTCRGGFPCNPLPILGPFLSGTLGVLMDERILSVYWGKFNPQDRPEKETLQTKRGAVVSERCGRKVNESMFTSSVIRKNMAGHGDNNDMETMTANKIL